MQTYSLLLINWCLGDPRITLSSEGCCFFMWELFLLSPSWFLPSNCNWVFKSSPSWFLYPYFSFMSLSVAFAFYLTSLQPHPLGCSLLSCYPFGSKHCSSGKPSLTLEPLFPFPGLSLSVPFWYSAGPVLMSRAPPQCARVHEAVWQCMARVGHSLWVLPCDDIGIWKRGRGK